MVSPASVRRRWRVVRSIRRRPRLLSSRCTAALRLDLGWPSTRAAALKPPCCTTSQNSSQSRQSIGGNRPCGGTVCPGNPDTSETADGLEDGTKEARFAKHEREGRHVG